MNITILQTSPTYATDLTTDTPQLLREVVPGTWQALRALEPWEIMQAEDQRDYQIVISGELPAC